MKSKRVVVGMSGGVDSSVSALLLKQQGYEVIGLFMKNWEEKDPQGVCQAAKDYEDVLRVCEQITIPCYTVNFAQEYWDNVFVHFLEELQLGYTPNPDILCNKEIKFKALLEKAISLGADYLATGHYCQIGVGDSSCTLLKGADLNKDQSYFLYTLDSSILRHVLFPVGGMDKAEVRRIAREYGLANSEKKDSTGICFIGKRDFKEFLSPYLAYQRGNFENLQGQVIGQHDGIAYYTIGQRKGLGIGGAGEPWFVVGKDPARNVVVIEQGTDHHALYTDRLVALAPSWVAGSSPPLPYACKAKIRYRQPEQECIIEQFAEGKLSVRFLTPQRAITPRQAIVFYQDAICLGGATIA